MIRAHAIEPVLSISRIVEPLVFYDRQIRESLGKRGCEHAATGSDDLPPVATHRYTLQPATGRALLEDVPAESLTRKLVDPAPRVRSHRVGMIRPAPDTDHVNATVPLNQ